jgi:hypothetical protein
MQHGLYSGSLLDACGKLIYSVYFNLSPCRDISTNPAPMPSTLLDPSNYIVHTINKSGGPVFCSSSHSAVKSGKISDLTAFLFSYVMSNREISIPTRRHTLLLLGTAALTVKVLHLENTPVVELHELFLPCSSQLRVPCLPPNVWLQCIVIMVPFNLVQPALVVWRALFWRGQMPNLLPLSSRTFYPIFSWVLRTGGCFHQAMRQIDSTLQPTLLVVISHVALLASPLLILLEFSLG